MIGNIWWQQCGLVHGDDVTAEALVAAAVAVLVVLVVVVGWWWYLVWMLLIASSEVLMTYAAVGVLLVMAITFGVGNLVVTHLLGPNRQGDTKGSVYESGMNAVGTARKRFNVRFFLVAMTFLLFDVEIVFLYPWAVTFPALGDEIADGSGLSWVFLLRMVFFILTSIVAFVYAWKKGVFRYD